MSFITPIIDRTAEDVLYAMQNQNSTSDLKGAFNISDVNRIINNINYLNTQLQIVGYSSNISTQSEFVESDIAFLESKINVIRYNVKKIVDCFYKLNNPEISFNNTFGYEDANSLENNLKITNDLLVNLIAELKYCNEVVCGSEINL